jgi:ribosome biogenesis SPOUT family RNA methylase Rps3
MRLGAIATAAVTAMVDTGTAETERFMHVRITVLDASIEDYPAARDFAVMRAYRPTLAAMPARFVHSSSFSARTIGGVLGEHLRETSPRDATSASSVKTNLRDAGAPQQRARGCGGTAVRWPARLIPDSLSRGTRPSLRHS